MTIEVAAKKRTSRIEHDVPKVLRAESIELVDSEGRVRTRIVADNGYGTMFEMFDNAGTRHAFITVGSDGRYATFELENVAGARVLLEAAEDVEVVISDKIDDHFLGQAKCILSAPEGGYDASFVAAGTFPNKYSTGPNLLFGDRPRTLAVFERAERAAMAEACDFERSALKHRESGNKVAARKAQQASYRIVRKLNDLKRKYFPVAS